MFCTYQVGERGIYGNTALQSKTMLGDLDEIQYVTGDDPMSHKMLSE